MYNTLKNKAVAFLRWSEHYTKTDMLYLTEGGFWLTLSQVIGILTSLATSVAFANWLPEQTYGVYRYVLSVMPILIIPTLTGIDTALTRAVAQGKESTAYAALSLKMRWGMWGLVGSLVLAAYYYVQGDVRLMFLFLIAAAFVPLMEPFNLFVAFLAGRKDFPRRTLYGAFTRVVPTIVLVAIVFYTSNIFILVAGYFISYALTRFVALRMVLREVPREGAVDHAALGFGKHLSLMGIVSTIATSLDSILIFHYGGAAILAGYYLATIPYSQALNAFSNLTTLALPKFSLQSAENMRQSLPTKMARMYYVILPSVLLYLIAAPLLFSILYPKYVSYVFISDLFMVQLLLLPTGLFSTALTALGEKKKLYIISVTYAITRILLLLILTPLYGLMGTVAAIVISGIMIGFLKTYLFYRL